MHFAYRDRIENVREQKTEKTHYELMEESPSKAQLQESWRDT